MKAAQGVGLFPSAVSLLMQTKEDNILNTRIFFRHNASEFTSISVLLLHEGSRLCLKFRLSCSGDRDLLLWDRMLRTLVTIVLYFQFLNKNTFTSMKSCNDMDDTIKGPS